MFITNAASHDKAKPDCTPVWTPMINYQRYWEQAMAHKNTFPFLISEPTINWYLNDAIIKPSRYFMMMYQDGAARLLINEVFPEDEGMYKCEATNSQGRVACTAKLTVAGTPPGDDL